MGAYDISSLEKKVAVLDRLLPTIKYLPAERRNEEVDYIANLAGHALPDDLMMSSSQVKELRSSGMEIGAHTISHPILANIDLAEARREMLEGREYLENLLGEPVELFAYPNGKPGKDYLPEHAVLAREVGFKAAVSTSWGVSTRYTDLWQLPRFTPWDKEPSRFFLRLLANYRKAS